MLLNINQTALALLMASKGITQGELLALAQISQAVMKRIQSGKPIKPVTVGKIANALACAPADIVTQH